MTRDQKAEIVRRILQVHLPILAEEVYLATAEDPKEADTILLNVAGSLLLTLLRDMRIIHGDTWSLEHRQSAWGELSESLFDAVFAPIGHDVSAKAAVKH